MTQSDSNPEPSSSSAPMGVASNGEDVELPRGTRIDDVEIVATIGSGGMGVVYSVLQQQPDGSLETRAIKMLRSQLVANPLAKKRLEREVDASSRIVHENVGRVHELRRGSKGRSYVLMELLVGRTLKDELAERIAQRMGPMAIDRSSAIAIGVASGLAAAHRAGIVHRDLKPSNIFMTEDGAPRILDFGIAKVLASPELTELTQTGVVLGTVGYMAPEQIRDPNVDHRADVFALGAILYEMLTQRKLYPGATTLEILKQRLSPIRDPRTLNAQIPDALWDLVRRTLAEDPERRPALDELIAGLERMRNPKLVLPMPSSSSSVPKTPAPLSLPRPSVSVVRAPEKASLNGPLVIGSIFALALVGFAVKSAMKPPRAATVVQLAADPPAPVSAPQQRAAPPMIRVEAPAPPPPAAEVKPIEKNPAEPAAPAQATPLRASIHEAVRENDEKAVAELIRKGLGEANGRDSALRTPLHVAVLYNRPRMIDVLLEYGADPELGDDGGNTPLHAAIAHEVEPSRNGCAERLLLKRASVLDVRGAKGATPLVLAVMLEKPRWVSWLLDAGASTRLAGNDGGTPLLHAAKRGNVEIVKLLLEHHADPSPEANGNFDPIDIAERSGHTRVAEMLRTR